MQTPSAVLNQLQHLGLQQPRAVHYNLSVPQLVEQAVCRGEGQLTEHGAFVGLTSPYTGRSPEDRFVVREPGSEAEVGWGKVNKPFEEGKFDAMLARMMDYAKEKELFVIDAFAGADERFRLPVRIVAEKAWHAHFVTNMFIQPGGVAPEHDEQPFTVVDLCGFKADPERDGTRSEVFILVHLSRRLVLIGGTHYAGEMKKSVFGALNFLLPRQGVFPMHCSANTDGETTAVYFGLSGTGKTTLSADASRTLVGDDEHGWSEHGIFNFEGGCYAKTIKLSPEGEPEIFATTQRFGTVLENVVMDTQTRRVDFDSDAITENTRASYPIDFIPNASECGEAGHPEYVIFLTADAFGVLPPVSRLTPEQAMYQFLSGYTAKVAGTERGVKEPKATFSTCFGAPFMVRPATDYAQLLGERLRTHDAKCFLLNTGWTGGPYGTGSRHKLAHTRAMVQAILSGALDNVETRTEPYFGLAVPVQVPGVPSEVLDPRATWADTAAYDEQARRLQTMFADNFEQFADSVSEAVREAGPKPEIVA